MALLHEGGFTVTELSGIEPNPRIESVAEGVRLCKENDVDVILAVGGGSTIDCAKAIACGVFYVLHYMMVFRLHPLLIKNI